LLYLLLEVAPMCRFVLYLGPPVRLATLLTEPSHSLIHQSFRALEREEPLNGDGFGLAWYAPRLTTEPALFHAITPAWNHRNLGSIAQGVASPCILAHVRAASEGSVVMLANCHPFAQGRYTFMHNGHIGGFRRIRRRLLEGLGDEAFDAVGGSSDTEHLFALFLDEMARQATDSSGEDGDPLLGPLSSALQRVLTLSREHGGGESSFLNVAVADGSRAVVTRFADDAEEGPESLYLLRGELYEPAGRRFTQRRADDEGEAVVVASERLTDDPRWTEVPRNSMLVLDRYAAPVSLALDRDGRVVKAVGTPVSA
jgi:glutamine amidotransferase